MKDKALGNIFEYYPELGKDSITDPAAGIRILSHAINDFRKEKRNDLLAEAYYYMAECNFLVGDVNKVVSYAMQAIGYLRQCSGKEYLLPLCYNMAGIGYTGTGEYNIGQQFYIDALKYSKEMKDERTKLSVENNIGSLFLQLGDYQEAGKYMRNVYELAVKRMFASEFSSLSEKDQQDRREMYYVAMLNMADIYFHEGNFDESLRLLDKLESSMAGKVTPIYEYNCFTIRAKDYLEMGDIELTKELLGAFFERLEDEEELSLSTELFEDYCEIVNLLLEHKQYELAAKTLEIIKNLCESIDRVSRWTTYYGLMAKYYLASGQVDEYLTACAQYHNYGMKKAKETNRAMLQGIKNQMEIDRSIEIQKAQAEQAEEMRLLSETDELTQLLNRRSFNRLSQKYFEVSEESGKPFGLVMMDIDFFKQFNDQYGHVAGDRCLKMVADILKRNEQKREGFLCSRYGGDEFIIICRERENDEIKEFMNAVIADVRDIRMEHVKSPITDYVTVSIGGINAIPGVKNTVMDLVQMADDALYEAKAQGKNRALFVE